jgi:hypothetical protein
LGDLFVCEFEAEALFQERLQLNATEAVEVKVCGQARGVRLRGWRFSGNAGDHIEEHITSAACGVSGGCGELLAGPGRNHASQEFTGGGEGKAGLGPAEDVTDLLEVGEGAVGKLESLPQVCVVDVGQENGDGLGAVGALTADDDSRSDSGLLAEFGLQICRVEIQPSGRDDSISAAPGEAEFAGGVLGCEIAGCEPLTGARVDVPVCPCGAGDDIAADEDFPLRADADLAPGE